LPPAGGRRSVFSNYRAHTASDPDELAGSPPQTASRAEATPGSPNAPEASAPLAVARTFLYRFLAKAFEDPTPAGWEWLCSADTHAALRSVLEGFDSALAAPLRDSAERVLACLTPEGCEPFQDDYNAAFGHAARGRCPVNEIEYSDIKADPLFQPHRLADLAAFYRAFGLEVAPDAAERHDHLCLELEFMSVLAAKEAYALQGTLGHDFWELCRDTQKKFLREHLGRWTPAFTRRLVRMVDDGALGRLAVFTREFVEAECRAFGLTPGSEDLLLRPVDEAAESLCAACGLPNLPPGAVPSPA
jgi:DMSO reductase family type II enzyme chaperone